MRKIKTDRSLLKYVVFNILTCGIYGFFFIQGLSKDMNTMCAGDGKHTRGFWGWLGLNLCTVGIYSLVWMRDIGNRQALNATRFGCDFEETGTSLLWWTTAGLFLFLLGPFIAMNILIRNTNSMAASYNRPKITTRIFRDKLIRRIIKNNQ